MKKIRQFFLTIILLTTGLTYGQSFIGVKVNGGLSYFKTELKMYPPSPMTQEFHPMLSGQGGITYNYIFKNKFLIGTELLYTQIEGKEYLKVLTGVTTNGNFISDNGFYEKNSFRHIYYLGLPIYFGYNVKRLNLNLGFQANLALASGSQSYLNGIYSNGEAFSYDTNQNDLDISKLDFGGRIGIFYKLSDKYSIETNYYYGLTNLIKDKNINEPPVWHIQQLTFGLRYNLFMLERGETKNK
jgi:hypothetical protein